MSSTNADKSGYDEFMEGVWRIKEQISKEIIDMTPDQRREYFRAAREAFERRVGYKLPIAGPKRREIKRP